MWWDSACCSRCRSRYLWEFAVFSRSEKERPLLRRGREASRTIQFNGRIIGTRLAAEMISIVAAMIVVVVTAMIITVGIEAAVAIAIDVSVVVAVVAEPDTLVIPATWDPISAVIV